MEVRPKANSRTFDWIALSILACLFAKGYLIEMQPKLNEVYWATHLFYGSYLEIAALALVSFLAVFYAFRVHTRVLWIIGAPLIVAAMPVFGANVFERLNHAPGEERFVMMKDPSGLLIVYFSFLLGWLLVLALGLRLRAKSDATLRPQMSIQELMAITAVVAALLFSCRHSVQVSQLQWGDLIARILESRLRMLYSLLGLFLSFGGLIVGLLLRSKRWIAVPLLFSIAGVCCLAWMHLTTTRRWYNSYNGFVPVVAWWVVSIAMPLMIVSIASGVARENGYRLTRGRRLFEDEAKQQFDVGPERQS